MLIALAQMVTDRMDCGYSGQVGQVTHSNCKSSSIMQQCWCTVHHYRHEIVSQPMVVYNISLADQVKMKLVDSKSYANVEPDCGRATRSLTLTSNRQNCELEKEVILQQVENDSRGARKWLFDGFH